MMKNIDRDVGIIVTDYYYVRASKEFVINVSFHESTDTVESLSANTCCDQTRMFPIASNSQNKNLHAVLYFAWGEGHYDAGFYGFPTLSYFDKMVRDLPLEEESSTSWILVLPMYPWTIDYD